MNATATTMITRAITITTASTTMAMMVTKPTRRAGLNHTIYDSRAFGKGKGKGALSSHHHCRSLTSLALLVGILFVPYHRHAYVLCLIYFGLLELLKPGRACTSTYIIYMLALYISIPIMNTNPQEERGH